MKSPKGVATAVALAALTVLVIVLGIQNGMLREENADLTQALYEERFGASTGSAPDRISSQSLAGESFVIGGASESGTALYFFSTRCGFCSASLPQVRALEASAKGAGGALKLVGIGLRPFDEVSDYVARERLEMDVVMDLEGELTKAYNVGMTPLLIVLDRQGVVAYKHVGQLDDDVVQGALNSIGLGAGQ